MSALDHPVIGFRAWLPTPGHMGQLDSCFFGPYHWLQGVNEAVCFGRHRDETGEYVDQFWQTQPSAFCNCGLQAHHDFDGSQFYFKKRHFQDELVYGVIKGWGHMHIHPDGWRSQYAEIVAIIPSPNMEAARAAATFYNVPLLPSIESVDALASEFGKKVPKEFRPSKEPTGETLAKWAINNPQEASVVFGTIFGTYLTVYMIKRLAWKVLKRALHS